MTTSAGASAFISLFAALVVFKFMPDTKTEEPSTSAVENE
jgi:hypothetical protein